VLNISIKRKEEEKLDEGGKDSSRLTAKRGRRSPVLRRGERVIRKWEGMRSHVRSAERKWKGHHRKPGVKG